MKEYCEENSLNVWDYLPITYTFELFQSMTRVQIMHFQHFFKNVGLAHDKKNKNRNRNFRKINSMIPPSHNLGQNVWLLKPAGYNRGIGIHVFDNLQTLDNLISDYKKLANNEKVPHRSRSIVPTKACGSRFVLQKYIERPMLFKRRKFDIRVWVVLTHDMKVYMFHEGYLRTSCNPYECSNFNNIYIHLTNNAVQKDCIQYGIYEEGN
jgi:hypothetical protein